MAGEDISPDAIAVMLDETPDKVTFRMSIISVDYLFVNVNHPINHSPTFCKTYFP